MKAEAILVGERLIDAEAALDRRFLAGGVTAADLSAAVSHIAKLQGDLRSAHLRYHLAMVELLSPAQVARFNQLRRYVPVPQ